MAKSVAATIKNFTTGDTLAAFTDRRAPVSDIAQELSSHWNVDLFTRKPGPALNEHGEFQKTDLALADFLSAFVERRAVIEIPSYKVSKPVSRLEGQRHVGNGEHFGNIIGLSANKETFAFSVRINDMTVLNTDVNDFTSVQDSKRDKLGAPRNFMLVDPKGDWYKGFKKLTFSPTAKENDFMNDRKLWVANTVFFKNWVHPNRWTSVYGQYYLATKVAIQRIEEEATFLRKEIKRLLESGVNYPFRQDEDDNDLAPKSHGSRTTDEGVSVKVPAFEMEVDIPMIGDYAPLSRTQSALIEATKRVKYWQFKLLPQLRFATRCSEMAFVQAGAKDRGFPTWIKNAEWVEGYRTSNRSKIDWTRLVLNQRKVGEQGIALRYRLYEKSEILAK